MNRYVFVVLIVFAGCSKNPVSEYLPEKKWMVTTIAGNGDASFTNGPALSATFHFPEDVAIVDEELFVTDVLNLCVRKISSGQVTTFVGGSGFDILNGTGVTAKFKNPFSIAVDANGNIYTSDANDPRIRKMSHEGVVITYAGTELQGFADGNRDTAQFGSGTSIVADQQGNLFVSDAQNNRVRRISTDGDVTTIAGSGIAGFREGAALQAQFVLPGGIAIDKFDNLYVVDRGNLRIRKISPSGIVSTVAGSGVEGFKDTITSEAQFSFDLHDIVADPEGNLFVADANRIRMIGVNGTVTTIAGSVEGFEDGEGASAKFNFTAGMAIDPNGSIYIADLNNNRIRKLSYK